MTVVKQTSVKSPRHLKRLESYLDWDREKALDHWTQNLCAEDCREAFREMESTRRAYGHDRPGKVGCRTSYAEHQILAFEPSECSCNGGPMTPERCMEYVRDYVTERYLSQEVIAVLHLEHCASDGTDRFAAHLCVSRTNLDTGRRLNEGPSRRAAQARVATVRELDERYGLRQLERGRNSKVHARQPSRAEREWQRRDASHRSENDFVRERVAVRASEVARLASCDNHPRELARRLSDDGITMTLSGGGDVQFRFRSESLERTGSGGERKVNGATLGSVVNRRTGATIGLDRSGLFAALGVGKAIARTIERGMDDGGREP